MVSMICKSSFLLGQYLGSSSVLFANQNFSRHRKAMLLRKWVALILQVKFRFMGCLVKVSALLSGDSIIVLITVNSIIVSTKQPSAEKYLTNIFFVIIFVNFQKILVVHQRNILKFFRNLTKRHPWRSLILVRLQTFTKAASRSVL